MVRMDLKRSALCGLTSHPCVLDKRLSISSHVSETSVDCTSLNHCRIIIILLKTTLLIV
jgi:hypothetical protein